MREDLRTQITDVFPTDGTILVVHPKYDVQFNPDYCDWLADNLRNLLPPGVRGMVLSQNLSNFNVIGPESDDPEYIRGWNDAVNAISELNP